MSNEDDPQQLSLGKEIWFRIKLPFKPLSWAFLLYLFFFVIGYGGLGVWLTVYTYSGTEEHLSHIPPAIGTYFLALWATSFFDLNTSKDVINKKSIFNISIAGLGLAILFLFLAYENTLISYLWALLGLIISIMYWIFVNSDNQSFYESFEEQVKGEAKQKHGKGWG